MCAWSISPPRLEGMRTASHGVCVGLVPRLAKDCARVVSGREGVDRQGNTIGIAPLARGMTFIDMISAYWVTLERSDGS